LKDLKRHEVRQYPNPLIDFTEILIPSEIIIKQKNNSFIEVTYKNKLGKLITCSREIKKDDRKFGWHQKMLVYQSRISASTAPIAPRNAKHYRMTRFFLDEERNLVVVGSFTEVGMAIFIVPFKDHSEIKLLLKRTGK